MLYSYGTEPVSKYIGKKIIDASADDTEVSITFGDGVKISIYDDGQSCCEYRYMKHEDDVTQLIGGRLISIEVKDAPFDYDDDDTGEVHDVEFLEIQTTNGYVNISNHNEHNGYYGGFNVVIKEIK